MMRGYLGERGALGWKGWGERTLARGGWEGLAVRLSQLDWSSLWGGGVRGLKQGVEAVSTKGTAFSFLCGLTTRLWMRIETSFELSIIIFYLYWVEIAFHLNPPHSTTPPFPTDLPAGLEGWVCK
jgi:hypothetical protein